MAKAISLPVERPSKICESCGRAMTWRKKWAREWENVKYCSDACRRRKGSSVDQKLEEVILSLLEARAATDTICPSEARRVGGDDWRPLMEPARRAARRLRQLGKVRILQNGQPVDPTTARGPIRIGKVR